MAEYTEITDPGLKERVRARYQREIGVLQALGYRHLAYCLEALGPYSAILNLPVLLLAFNKEVIVILRPLRLAVGNVLLFHTDPPSIALCMGMGVKLYSSLPEGTLLVSSDFQTPARPRPESRILRRSPYPSIEATWQAHRKEASPSLAEGRSPSGSPTLLQYMEMSHREEDLTQYY